MNDLKSVINELPGEYPLKVLPALKILVDAGLFKAVARANGNQLVEGRIDSDDEAALIKEIRETRQTNRVLIGFEESARQLTKGIEE
ncbi:MAG: hypothetical protein ACRCZI_09720 [Cetobacterium sp.]